MSPDVIVDIQATDPITVGYSLLFKEEGSSKWIAVPMNLPLEARKPPTMETTDLLHDYMKKSKISQLSWLAFLSAEMSESEGAEVIGRRLFKISPEPYESVKIKPVADATRKSLEKNGREWAYVAGVSFCTVTSRIFTTKKKQWKGTFTAVVGDENFYDKSGFRLKEITTAQIYSLGVDGAKPLKSPMLLKSSSPVIITGHN